jgi:hypothetical protein
MHRNQGIKESIKQIGFTLYLVDCLTVVGIALVRRGPEKSCGTRILGLAKIGAVNARALPTTPWLKYVIRLKLITLIIFVRVRARRGAMAA